MGLLPPTGLRRDVLFASTWQVRGHPWLSYFMPEIGTGSGIFKSTDGGDTWNEITRNPGLPKGTIGNIGITVSPVNSDRVWAIVEAEEGGVFRSDNAGKSWSKVNEQRNLRQRAWYYTRIYADPKNVDTVYVLNTGFYKSNDGGRTYSSIRVGHGDCHDLWVAPTDPSRVILGDDGGAEVSFNGGGSWSSAARAIASLGRTHAWSTVSTGGVSVPASTAMLGSLMLPVMLPPAE